MEDIVSLSRVQKSFGALAAVRDLDLAVREGEFLTLLGPSGCGKTTTLRLISGFETADGGDIRIAGTRVNDVPPYRRNVNTVFQSYALFPHLSVFDNVAYGLSVRGVDKAAIRRRVEAMLARVELSDKAKSMPRQLSGGQMQRIALARALINEPRVLLLDEPLSALDAKLRRSMQMELKQTQRELGISFVYVTHDQEEALALSDRIAVMDRGRLVQLGTPEDVFERPAGRFVAEFVGSNNFVEGRIERIDEGTAEVRDTAGILWLASAEPCFAAGHQVTLAVRPQRLRIAAAGETEPGETAIDGTFFDATYVGTAIRIAVEIPGGRMLQVEAAPEMLGPGYRAMRRGDPVRLLCPPAGTKLFAA